MLQILLGYQLKICSFLLSISLFNKKKLKKKMHKRVFTCASHLSVSGNLDSSPKALQ